MTRNATFRQSGLRRGFIRTAAAALAAFCVTASAATRVYPGHYASGSAAWTIEDGRVYRGHYASGTAAATLSGDAPADDMTLAFIAVIAGL